MRKLRNKIKLMKGEILREDGLRIERVCEHGVGHPVRTTRALTESEKKWAYVHGCDGCCFKAEFHFLELKDGKDV